MPRVEHMIASSLWLALALAGCGAPAPEHGTPRDAKAIEGGEGAGPPRTPPPSASSPADAEAKASAPTDAPAPQAPRDDAAGPPASPTEIDGPPTPLPALPVPPLPDPPPPGVPAVANPSLTPETAARHVLDWVRSRAPSDGLPPHLLARKAAIAVLVREDGCEGTDCTERTNKTPAELAAWLGEFDDMPGWDIAELGGCEGECCTYGNLAMEASREGASVPHELLEVRAVCLETEGADAGTLRRIKLIQY